MPSRSASDSVSNQPSRGERLAIGSKYRRHFGIGDAGRLAIAVHDAATQPGAVVGDCDEMLAIRLNMDAGDAAKGLIF